MKNPPGCAAQHARETHLPLPTNAAGGELKNKAPSALDPAKDTKAPRARTNFPHGKPKYGYTSGTRQA
jgi:hypothetical protein